MAITEITFVLMGIYLLFHLASIYLRRRVGRRDGRQAGSDGAREGESSPMTPAGEIRCPACGIANDPSYTFCQDCAAELPS